MRAAAFMVLALGALFAASEAAGQNRVQIVGTVLDEQTGEPIAGVDLVARDRHGVYRDAAISDDQGRFSFTVYRIPAVRIYAARIGYKRTGTPLLRFDENQFFEVELRLDPDVLLLAPLEVVARAGSTGSPVLSGFRQRLVGGMGHYITQVEIRRRNPGTVTDLLREVPGVRLTSSGRGMSRVIHMGRSEAMTCAVQLYVDGMLLNRGQGAGAAMQGDISLDDVVAPQDIIGIEIYRGLSTIPAEFYSNDAECGVVAVWTRRGER